MIKECLRNYYRLSQRVKASEMFICDCAPLSQHSSQHKAIMNRRIFIALATCFLTVLPAASKASSGEEAKAQEMVAMTVQHFKQHGAEATIVAINAGGSFKDGELYVFIVTLEGVSVANAADQTRVGMNMSDLLDSTGKPYVREILDSATAEGAWVHYMRINPATGKEQLKNSWVREVDGYVIGCGVYMGE
jgi:cytochrome c